MNLLQTPEARFADLTGFDFPTAYAQVRSPDGAEARMAYVDAGPPNGPVVLLLHGEPTWSYLYRSMITPLAEAGCRVIAPDLIGFGRSDKPAELADHTYARHVGWVFSLVCEVLDLHEVTLFCQDWGGLIGLRMVGEHLERFARVVASNTGLPTGDQAMPEIWWAFRNAVVEAEHLDVGRFVASGCVRGLSDTDRAAYDAPFPDETYKAGARALPVILPTSPDDPATKANRDAWQQLAQFDKPFLVAFADGDPITGAMAPVLKRAVPGAAALEHPVIENAGHFVQEDAGPELAQVILRFMQD